jgi:hypothetical protein
MRPRTRDRPGDSLGPRPTYSPRRTLAGAALLVTVFFAGLLAVSYPEPAVLAGSVVTAGGVTARTARDRLARRRKTGQTREVCLPASDVCVEA